MSKHFVRLALFTALASLLTACGAPQPPMPSGERIPVNDEYVIDKADGWDNGTSALFESNQINNKE